MDTAYRRMARRHLLERDADAALRALSRDERETLSRARAGAILDVPKDHQRRFAELCLGADRPGGFGLTDLGRCAADRVGVFDHEQSEVPRARDPLELVLASVSPRGKSR
jgi:hypothetical protein